MVQRLHAARDGQRRGIGAAGDRRIGNGRFTYTMDNGKPLRVAISVDRASRSAVVDFTGTGPQHEGNFNSPPAVTRAAVLYVFRCLVGDDIPLNDGCLKPMQAGHSARHVPVAAAGRGGGGGQHRGVAGHLQRAVRRAGGIACSRRR